MARFRSAPHGPSEHTCQQRNTWSSACALAPRSGRATDLPVDDPATTVPARCGRAGGTTGRTRYLSPRDLIAARDRAAPGHSVTSSADPSRRSGTGAGAAPPSPDADAATTAVNARTWSAPPAAPGTTSATASRTAQIPYLTPHPRPSL
ncbi:hypothetical protein EDD29_3679 [Actinocorallia herbida]|uniref:Uncharacterized protein n=1 Tax=Actinocorallia herbida TaxID=58109 RepID=A0A3N1CXZ4_9ACTN|nr:hypothetical protein [Actinocorallia herbida]ROO86116.1 hypothetical protein EDD29_3679 [Actinocorallia herbida]